jgi:DNA-binding HxlR family transcriptional regulator
VSILWASSAGALRFNEIRQSVGEIPPTTLAQRLVELERDGLLERRVLDSRPPQVEYRLTARGEQLRSVLDAIERFGGRSPDA